MPHYREVGERFGVSLSEIMQALLIRASWERLKSIDEGKPVSVTARLCQSPIKMYNSAHFEPEVKILVSTKANFFYKLLILRKHSLNFYLNLNKSNSSQSSNQLQLFSELDCWPRGER